MKLLIDIPEHIYEHAKESSEDSRDEFDAMRAIANGTQQESRSENPNTCGDAISRKDTCNAIIKRLGIKDETFLLEAERAIYQQILAMPSVTPQPCEDCINRQAAIKAIEALQLPIMREASTCYQFKFSGMSEAKEAVENLPSVTPQQRTGRWIKQNYGWNWQCSECGFVTPPSAKEIFTFCPNCGAKMEVEE